MFVCVFIWCYFRVLLPYVKKANMVQAVRRFGVEQIWNQNYNPFKKRHTHTPTAEQRNKKSAKRFYFMTKVWLLCFFLLSLFDESIRKGKKSDCVFIGILIRTLFLVSFLSLCICVSRKQSLCSPFSSTHSSFAVHLLNHFANIFDSNQFHFSQKSNHSCSVANLARERATRFKRCKMCNVQIVSSDEEICRLTKYCIFKTYFRWVLCHENIKHMHHLTYFDASKSVMTLTRKRKKRVCEKEKKNEGEKKNKNCIYFYWY